MTAVVLAFLDVVGALTVLCTAILAILIAAAEARRLWRCKHPAPAERTQPGPGPGPVPGAISPQVPPNARDEQEAPDSPPAPAHGGLVRHTEIKVYADCRTEISDHVRAGRSLTLPGHCHLCRPVPEWDADAEWQLYAPEGGQP